MENIFPADKFLNVTLHNNDVIAAADKTVRLSSIANHTLKKELWNDSLKVFLFNGATLYSQQLLSNMSSQN